jgi:hypothetical protein
LVVVRAVLVLLHLGGLSFLCSEKYYDKRQKMAIADI